MLRQAACSSVRSAEVGVWCWLNNQWKVVIFGRRGRSCWSAGMRIIATLPTDRGSMAYMDCLAEPEQTRFMPSLAGLLVRM